MPQVHGLEFGYALHELPPRGVPFRRWRWELWHGTQLVAAGWRLSRVDAARAVRYRAAEFGHRLFGLPVPAPDQAPRRDLLPGAAERLAVGPVTCLLVPRALDQAAPLAPSA